MPHRRQDASLQPPHPRQRQRPHYSLTLRVQCLTLLTEGYPGPEIEKKTGIPRRTQLNIQKKAQERGYCPEQDGRILEHFVEDKPRSGRPKEISIEKEQELLQNVRSNRASREKSSEILAYESNISCASALRILRKHGLHSVKPTRKPGLNPTQKAARLAFALEHQDWTLEDWKNVIWSDETSVILGHRRGAVRLWRDSKEMYEKTVIRRRWKGFSEFMFWGCFSYDYKGPCHIWTKETAKEKEKAEKELQELNELLEPSAKERWELETQMRRMNIHRRPGGRAPQWRFTEKAGKLVRNSKAGGIDWFRYWKVILLPKLIPFTKQCMQERPDTVIQDDNAPAHSHPHQASVYKLYNVQKLLWPGNSPDLNASEPAWFWMKKRTTKQGAATHRKEMEKKWYKGWQDLPQEQIQRWIRAIPDHIQEIIRLNGGNEYKEGEQGYKRSWAGHRIKGIKSSHQFVDRDIQQTTDAQDTQDDNEWLDEE